MLAPRKVKSEAQKRERGNLELALRYYESKQNDVDFENGEMYYLELRTKLKGLNK